jgi:MFS family permease
LPSNYRWNFVAFLVDIACFGVAFTLFNPNSVLPGFALQLTDSAPLIGLAGTIYTGGWLFPQLIVARLINDKPRKKPYMLAGLAGRAMWWVIALALCTGLVRHPMAMLTLFFVCVSLFAASDGAVSVTWFDILARAIPLQRRGRLIGMGQIISRLIGVGLGALIGLILHRYPFPSNYALMFALASVVLIPSAIALVLMREPPPEGDGLRPSGQAKGGWLRVLSKDPAFCRLMACRILISMIGLSTPFYVVHASKELHLPQSIIGGFVTAEMLAGVVSGAVLSPISERWGPRYVARIGSAVAATGPLSALVAHLAGRHLADGGWLALVYPFTYVAVGVLNSAFLLGFFNYLLEIAPEDMRPAYIGTSNTIMVPMMFTSVVGGWLLEATSYTTLFGVSAVLVSIGFLLTLGLKPPQQAAPVEHRQ